MDGDDSVLAALGGEVVDGLPDGLGDRAHGDDHALGVGVAVIFEGTVLAAGELADLAHIACNYVGNCFIYLVAGLDGLEVDVAVLGGAPGHGRLGGEGAGAEVLERLLADQFLEVLLVDGLDLLDLMGGAETVEEMQEGH